LTHLLSVPVDIIKIDKSFVDPLVAGDPSVAIVEGLIQIARKLGIRVIAEGIERED
jgi:sensor c-di-GMP phosphodiesterase-like protein